LLLNIITMEEILKIIRQWDENPEMRQSYPSGLKQLIEENLYDRSACITLIDYLYNEGKLKDII